MHRAPKTKTHAPKDDVIPQVAVTEAILSRR